MTFLHDIACGIGTLVTAAVLWWLFKPREESSDIEERFREE